ncbi:hypothetical protein GCM10009839_64910 [Catenulispora yoronensis]|uniref:DUF4307 domain-containing protein n=1 Tax=Catenulispora yoronensis TaxID=450799 RepID=A0ABP5GL11_9ACTN
MASEEQDEVVARYARSSGLSGRGRVALGVAGVLALTGVVSYIGLRQATPTLTATVLGYQVSSDHSVDVRFQVDNRHSDRGATCTVRARSSNGDEVGRLEVPVAAGRPSRELTATVKTSSRAITGEVVECRLT